MFFDSLFTFSLFSKRSTKKKLFLKRGGKEGGAETNKTATPSTLFFLFLLSSWLLELSVEKERVLVFR